VPCIAANIILTSTGIDGVFEPRNYSERMLSRYLKAKEKLERQIEKGITPDQTLEEVVKASRDAAAAAAHITTPQADTPPTETKASTPQPSSSVPQPQSLGMSGLNQAMERNKKEAQAAIIKRKQVLSENASTVMAFVKILIPVLVDVYNASATVKVRSRIITALQRSIAFCSDDQLIEVLQVSISRRACSITLANGMCTIRTYPSPVSSALS
jgi:E3 ubiquitin-protein ligase TRIP12